LNNDLKKIAYMTGEYPRATDTFIRREVILLREKGYSVKTISIRKPKKIENVGDERLQEENNTFYIFPRNIFNIANSHLKILVNKPKNYIKTLILAVKTSPPGLRNFIWQLLYFMEAPVVAEFIADNDIKHLHNHFADSSCTVAMLASSLGGFDFSFSIHGPSIFFEPKKWRLDEKVKQASFVRCISHFCRSQLYIWASEQYWNKSTIVHCAIDINKYAIANHIGQAKKLIFVGRLDTVKGVNVLLGIMPRLIAQYPDIELCLVGDGPSRNMLEKAVKENNIQDNVKFLGYRTPDEVSQLLSKSNIFVLPSFAEGLPVVLMEAMASGLPVVTTRIAGVAELVEHDYNGILVHAGDEESLYNSIKKLVDDPQLRETMGARGHEKVKKEFNLETEVTKLAEHFN